MILLIAGPPRCGKTTLAKRVAEKTNVSWISADSISGVARSTVESLPGSHDEYLKKAYPKVELRKKTNNSNDEMYTAYSAEEIVAAYTTEARACHPGLKALINSLEIEGHNLIIEGYQLTPELLTDVSGQDVESTVLIRSDVEQLAEDLQKNTAKNDWAIQKTTDPKTYDLIARMIVEFSKWYRLECEKYDIEYKSTDNFNARINKLTDELSAIYAR